MAEALSLSRTRSGSETRQRSGVVVVRVSADERAQLDAAAERAGMTLATYIRHQCLGTAGPRAVRRPPVERAAFSQLLGLLGKCGGNLNQIARALNLGRDVLVEEIAAAVADIRSAALDISATLRRRVP